MILLNDGEKAFAVVLVALQILGIPTASHVCVS